MTPLDTRLLDTEFGAVRVANRPGSPDLAPLVFVHGYPDNLQIWSRVFDQIEEDRRLIAFDWPGLGLSDTYTGGATPFHLGRHFMAVLDELDIEWAIPVGFDMGAHAVVAAAAKNPDRIERLILTNFLADGSVATSWDIAVMRKLGLNRLVLKFGARIIFERAQRTFLSDSTLSTEVRADMWSGFRRDDVRAHLRRMCAGYQASLPRVAKLYPDIDIETLILWADADPHFPLVQGEALNDALPDSSMHVLGGASHWLMWENPAWFASQIALFLTD